MGICVNCIHVGSKISGDPEDFYCLNEDNQTVDYITGRKTDGQCREINYYGECLKYNPVIPYESFKQISDKIYEVEFEYLDKQFFDQYGYKTKDFLSSSIAKENFIGHNVDHLYDKSVVVVNKISHSRNRLASVSTSIFDKSFIDNIFDIEDNLDSSKILPFLAVNGINEAGLVATLNYLPYTSLEADTVPAKYQRDKIKFPSIIRFILDNFSAAEEAVRYIRNYISLQNAVNAQVFVSDGAESYCLTIINNSISFKAVPYLTNMDMTNDLVFDEETKFIDKTCVRDYDKGIERFDIITSNIEEINSLEGMTDLLRNLFYTNKYKSATEPVWLSEFTGGLLTNQSPDSDFDSIRSEEEIKYNNRTDDPDDPQFGTSHTLTSTVFDTSSKTMYLTIAEGNEQKVFSVEETL